MLEIASKIVAFIVATIGAITTIFNVFFKGERERKQIYYEHLLKPFTVAYKKNPAINTMEFVEGKVGREDDNIPKYIFRLLEVQQSEDILRKVLLYDYLNLYPNEYNKKRSLLEIVHKVIDYVMFLLLFLFVFYGALLMTSGFMTLVTLVFSKEISPLSDWWNGIKEILVGIGVSLLGIIPVKFSEWLSKDMYSVKKKHIERTIKKKTRRFDRSFEDYII